MENYYWYERAKCGSCSQYIWTTSDNQSVVCACNLSSIVNGVLAGNSQIVLNETEFRQAVESDTGNTYLLIAMGT